MSTRPPPLSGGVRIYAKAPRKGGEGRQGERGGGIARPGWLDALPCSLLVDRWRGGGEVWRRLRPEPDEVAALPFVLVAGAMVAKW